MTWTSDELLRVWFATPLREAYAKAPVAIDRIPVVFLHRSLELAFLQMASFVTSTIGKR